VHKGVATLIAVVVGILAISAPILLSLYLAQQQSESDQFDHVTMIAKDVLRRADETESQIASAFRQLESKSNVMTDPCSDDGVRLMTRIAVASEQLQAVGYVAGDHLKCSSFGSSFGRFGVGIPVGSPTYRSAGGVYVRTAVEIPEISRGVKFILVTRIGSGYTAIVHPYLPLDVSVGDTKVSLGLFSLSQKKLIDGRETFDPQWIKALGMDQSVALVQNNNIVAVQRSLTGDYAAFAAIPAESMQAGLRRYAVILVPIGIAAGIVLAFAVLYLARQQLALPAVLKLALRRNEFFVEYQPVVDLRTGHWTGAEVLIRWRRPNGEMVRPDLFIPVAEDTGLIQRVTERVMNIVGGEVGDLFARHPNFHLAINLAPADLQDRRTVDLLRSLLGKIGARGDNLLVELTERGLVRVEMVRKVLQEIRALGIRIAVDDFGTGYSSLSYLQSFDLDILKIDKSFVDTIGTDAATSQVVTHIIAMAKSLKLEMIAEGVESQAQAQFLQERGVQFAQGWLYSKPLAFAELTARLAAARDAA